MKPMLIALVVAAVCALSGELVLSQFQGPVSTEFSAPSVRL